MFRRVIKNPSFYGLEHHSNEDIKKFLDDLVTRVFTRLEESKCI